MYLERPVVQANLARLRRLVAPGSRLLFDAWNSEAEGWRGALEGLFYGFLRCLGEPIVFDAPPPAVAAICRVAGWSVHGWRRAADVEGFEGAHGAEVFFELVAAGVPRRA